ncbi:phage tail terminator family protein [Peptostreptococcus canis]|uniref:Phage protein n=1 Tax=Peptostreptococcus canis TaxID=1159213 RepID=A0ABR6TMC7_9FIRM|nr:hypothetical protein [Peptostreptococcus canis]MBC2576576.1 hypothetical protein [Peptostreptococcus canis]MBP1998763.1 hypothetical protein [Peptostreptococcus canis]
MITIMDVKKALNKKLKEATGVNVGSKKIDENFRGPIFFTEIQIIKSSAINKFLHENSLRLRILYYPEKKFDKIDIFKTLNELEKSFRLNFKVLDRVLNVQDISFDIDEEKGFLYFTFKTQYITKYERNEEYDLMEDLKLNL